MTLALITLLSALSISAIAALYSLLGLAAIFSAAKLPVLLMGGVLEVGKLVTASWLYQNWNKTPLLLKSYLTLAVVVLIFITSMGIFGFLSKAHLDQTIATGDNTVVIERIEQKITREVTTIEDATKVIGQLDEAVQILMNFDRIRGPEGAIAVRQSQKEERAELEAVISEAQNNIDELEGEKLVLSKEQIALEAEVGPLKYIAELIYGDEAKDHFDEAVRWVILLLIFVFDPLAVLLLIAANQSLREYQDEKKKFTVPTEQVGDFTELSTDRVQEVDIPEGVDTVSEDKSEVPENVETSVIEKKNTEVDAHAVQVPGIIDTEETEESKPETKEVHTISEETKRTDETEQVKKIVSEDEDTLWEKFKKRREWKVPNSGIVHHDYIEENRRVENDKKK